MNGQRDFSKWCNRTPNIRENILKMIHACKSGHPGGSLSMVEILYALLGANGVMKHDPKKITGNDRDRLILSKGHGVPALYAVLSDIGHDISQEELMELRQLGSRLQGHPDRARLPIVESSTGSLGQGASIAEGMAMAYKMDNNPHRVYCIVGDGEMQEGQIWEVALSAPHHKLNNLTLILDYNKGQIDGAVKDVLSLDPVKQKWEAFGWNVHEVDGHNYQALVGALENTDTSKPTMIVANTIKGKGVSFMEGDWSWHGIAPSDDQLKQAIKELKQKQNIGME